MPFDRYKNSFGGTIEGIPKIGVDNFEKKNKMAYFLSHMHTDHTGGLLGKENASEMKDYLKKNKGKIYMTKETKIIFRHNKKYSSEYKSVKNFIVVLATDEEHYLEELKLTVTLIPVTHMPGAVMFLFRTQPPEEKTTLYTGDFVFDTEDLAKFKALHDADRNPIAIDLVYYDATFDNDSYRNKSLPDTKECVEKAAKLIKEWLLGDPMNAVAISKPYTYGFEGLFSGIYAKLDSEEDETRTNLGNIKISIADPELWKVYGKILEDTDIVYTKKASRIHVCVDKTMMDHELCFSEEECQNENYNYLKIAVATLNWRPPKDNSPIKQNKTGTNLYNMCYPTHCSQDKLDEFMQYFRINTDPLYCVPFSKNSCSTTKRTQAPEESSGAESSSSEEESTTDDSEESITKTLAELAL